MLVVKSSDDEISIHALVKRATTNTGDYSAASVISIHALVKRATRSCRLGGEYRDISIHALVKRATYLNHHNRLPLAEFQSTPS